MRSVRNGRQPAVLFGRLIMSDNPYTTQSSDDNVPPRKRWRYQTLTNILVCVAIVVVFIGLLLPATRSTRGPSRRMTCSYNLRQLGMALLNYEQAHHEFPPAYTVDENGKRLHSWRALILPYIEENDLYSKIDFSKPWDDPANEAVRKTSVSVFACPSAKLTGGHTTYLTVVTANSCLQPGKGRKLDELIDATTDTVLVFETSPKASVHWMDPHDADEELFLDVGSNHIGGANVVMADNSVRFFSVNISKELLKAMITIDGMEDIEGIVE